MQVKRSAAAPCGGATATRTLARARAGDQQAFAALTDAYLTQRWQRAEHREERAEQKREAKAALQREACARYLSATEGVVMAVSTSPPLEDAGQRGGDRKRALREQNAQLIAEMSVAEHQARLLAGDKVLAAIDTLRSAPEWLPGTGPRGR